MKQRITMKQLSELSNEQRNKLDKYDDPLLNIGQMIEIIQDLKPLKSISKARFDKWIVNIETATLGYKDELCDSLWETITRII